MARGAIVLPSFYDAIKDLPDPERLLMYDAMMKYQFYGEVVDLPPLLQGYFMLMKPNIDSSRNRYDASRENGAKGGAPRGNQNARKKQPDKQPEVSGSNNQRNNHDIDTNIDSDTNIDFEIDSDNYSDTDTDEDRDSLEGKGETEREPYRPLTPEEFDKNRNNWIEALDIMKKKG